MFFFHFLEPFPHSFTRVWIVSFVFSKTDSLHVLLFVYANVKKIKINQSPFYLNEVSLVFQSNKASPLRIAFVL